MNNQAVRVGAEAAIPVIDLFAGPGGLGEGFAALGRPGGTPRFRIALSIEKDATAHQTLELRAFFRQFPRASLVGDSGNPHDMSDAHASPLVTA